MVKLERILQGENGEFYVGDKRKILSGWTRTAGKIGTIVVQNPCLDISDEINKMAQRESAFIPWSANAYVVSDFSGDTQHIRKDADGNEKSYSVYAIQFYTIPHYMISK